MRFIGRVGLVVAAFAVTMAMSTKADAALLTLNDGADVWTLNVATNCDICAVTLQVQYGLNGTSSHEGDLLSSVQWSTAPELMPQTAADLGYASFTATSGTGTDDSWSFSLNNLNANGCTGGSQSKACGQWVPSLGTSAFGFGPITDGMVLTWTFNTNFAETFTALTSGNIRAAYKDPVTGKNAGIFSPGGGNFGGGGGGGGGVVPEPASLLLFGMAAFGGAYRVRRRRSA